MWICSQQCGIPAAANTVPTLQSIFRCTAHCQRCKMELIKEMMPLLQKWPCLKGKSVLGGVLCPVVTATDNFSRPQASRGVLILPNRLPVFLPSDEKACRETIHHTIHQVSWEILIPHLPKRCSKRTCFMIFLGTTVKTHCSRTLWYTWQLSES